MSTLLRIDRLTYRHPEASINMLAQVSLVVATGQTVAVVGVSGSGKTTLLRLIGGQLNADEGSIWLSGERVTGPSRNLVPGHPDVRTVFQDFALSPKLSVYQNIAHVLRAYRRDYREARTRELIERFRLVGREEQLPVSLAGGEKQRVALARALAEAPQLLLMDEPFSQVDAPLKRHLLREIRDILQATSGTAIFVTHDTQDALALADRMVVLRQGTVVQQGTPSQVYERPATPYVAQLLGACYLVPTNVWRRWFPGPVPAAHAVGIRPEHLRLSSSREGIRGEVVRSSYRGANYEVAIKLEENVEVSLFHHEALKPTVAVKVDIATDRVIWFNRDVAPLEESD